MNAGSLLPPQFWSALALCALAFLALWWFVLARGRIGRRRALRQRIAALDAEAFPPAPLDLLGMQQAMRDSRRAAERAGAPPALRHALYAVPWFLFLGDGAAQVGRLLHGAGAPAPPLGDEPDFWRWHFLHALVAVQVTPALLDPAAGPREQGLWCRALLELAERRQRLPLNGIVACIGAASLRGDAHALEALALALRRRVDEAAERLRVRLPVYLVVTGLEQLDGYAAVRSVLSEPVSRQAVGHRMAEAVPAGGDAGLRLDFVFDELGPQLHALRMALLQALPDAAGRRAAHAFVEQLCKLQPGLRQAAQQLFGAPGGLRAPRWRGLYLTAAPSEAGGGAFITDLFGRFLPADQPLAR